MARVTRPFTVEVKRHKFSIKASTADEPAGVAPTLEQLIQVSPRIDRPLAARPAAPDDARAAAEALFAGMAAAPREPAQALAGGSARPLSAPSGRVLEDLTAPKPTMPLLRPEPEAAPRGRRPREQGIDAGGAAETLRREARRPRPKGEGETSIFITADPDRTDGAARARPGRPRRETAAGDSTPGHGPEPRRAVAHGQPKKRFDPESLPDLPVVLSPARVQVVVQTDDLGEPRGLSRRAERPLRRGEQWKRRLPKVCW